LSRRGLFESAWLAPNGEKMSVFVYIALTVVVFALLGLTQKLVERL
jgi:hypothetical protein